MPPLDSLNRVHSMSCTADVPTQSTPPSTLRQGYCIVGACWQCEGGHGCCMLDSMHVQVIWRGVGALLQERASW